MFKLEFESDDREFKLIEMIELNEAMPGMRSAEYQATIPLKFS